jgi:hypothetical protein
VSADNVTPIRPEDVVPISQSALRGLAMDLEVARVTVFLWAQTLGAGDERTDLESHSATLLRIASGELDEICDQLLVMRPGLTAADPSPEEGEERS